jgi:cytochrome c2
MKKTLSLTATIAVLAFSSISYANAGDAAKGKKVFNKCKACHTVVAGKHRIGPSLAGVFGRTAGTAKKYKFSKAMKKAGKGGLVWDVKTMSEYLVKPRTYIKGTKMTFAGLKKKSQIDNLMTFLEEATK